MDAQTTRANGQLRKKDYLLATTSCLDKKTLKLFLQSKLLMR